MLSGAYDIPAIYASCRGVYTNTVPIDAYRGAGRPGSHLPARAPDGRRRPPARPAAGRNPPTQFHPAGANAYRTACGPTYDSGDFARNLKDALAAADWAGFEARRSEAKHAASCAAGGSPAAEICGFDEEEATLRCTGDGAVELLIGTQSTGQGHETAYAQIIADDLGVPFENVRVLQGDTDLIPFGRGTSGSRSLPVGGPAIRRRAPR